MNPHLQPNNCANFAQVVRPTRNEPCSLLPAHAGPTIGRAMRIAALLLFLAMVTPAWATPQFADEIVYEGNVYPFGTDEIDTWPLDRYLEMTGRPEVFHSEGMKTSGNWRGYIAKWEIREGSLLLVDIRKLHGDPKRDSSTWEWRHMPLDAILPNRRYPVVASWYSGSLNLSVGKLVGCFPFEHPSEEIRIRIEGGKIAKIERNRIAKAEDARSCH